MRVAAGKALVMAMVAVTFTGIHAQSPPAQPSQPTTTQPATQPATPPRPQPTPLSGAVGEPVPVQLPARVGIAQGADEALTLEAAIRLTLEQNNDVEVARLEVSGARQLVRAAEGVFDRASFRTSPTSARTPRTRPRSAAPREGRVTQKELFGGIQFAGRSPRQGGEFVVDFTQTRLETSNQFSRLNPQFPSLLNFSFTQPLFRDRAIDQGRRQILLSKKNVDLTDSQLRSVVTEQLTFVEQAYWDLVFASRNLEVQTSALAQARGQVASNERQVAGGHARADRRGRGADAGLALRADRGLRAAVADGSGKPPQEPDAARSHGAAVEPRDHAGGSDGSSRRRRSAWTRR